MKKNRLFLAALALLFCLSSGIVAFAAQNGSLKIVNISHSVTVYCVADSAGALTGDFAGSSVGELGADSDLVAHGKTLAWFVKENALSGQQLQPEGESVYMPALEEGFYLVCSDGDEFAPFLLQIPTQIGERLVYDVLADPKDDSTEQPTVPVDPADPDFQIPQTGRSVLPKLALLVAGIMTVGVGATLYLRGKKT